jgi:hypothetical protein
MSLLARLAHQVPASRRSYSFFSANGRYFKSHAIAATGPNSSDGRKPPVPGATSLKVKAGGSKTVRNDPSVAPETAEVNASAANAAQPGSATHSPSDATEWHTSAPTPTPMHPIPTAQDFRLHQFFSLDRPLLSLSHPGASVFQSTEGIFTPPFPRNASQSHYQAQSDANLGLGAFEDNFEGSSDADADAARQLARAIVMNRVGATVDFDAALRKLGLDVSGGRVPVEEMDMSELAIHLDSTKRKRKKKMKKHK